MDQNEGSLRIAIVGAGAAGLTAAYILQRRHKVTLFEKNAHVGGHVNTVVIPNGPEKWTPVDTGFMLLNDRNYPTFHQLLQKLNVAVRNTHLSFAYYDEKTGRQYAGTNLNGLFAQRSNLWNASFWLMLREIGWFGRNARRDLARGLLVQRTLGEYLEGSGFSQAFIRDYLLPLGSALWGTSTADMMEFPAELLARFFDHQGLLGGRNRPQWQTLVDGSHSYIRAIQKAMVARFRVKETVEEIKRLPAGDATPQEGGRILLRTKEGKEENFDRVVLAGHADESLALLTDPSEEEVRLLSPWRYQKNHATLHTDPDVMPPLRRAWAGWNYVRERDITRSGPVSLTYHVNRLQGLDTPTQYFVTFNRVRPIPQHQILKEFYFNHPVFTRESLATQGDLPSLNGVNLTYFCGSYFGNGFHEDAVRSGVAVARCFGMDL
jgi:predicted NAD/FAD-binding protein